MTSRRGQLVVIVLLLAGCARSAPPSSGSPQEEDLEPSATLTGRVQFEARRPTEQGASKGLELHPARFVEIEVQREDGEVLSRAATDEKGHFEVPSPRGASSLVVWARIKSADHDVAVTHDIDGRVVHHLSFPIRGFEDTKRIEVLASDSGPSGEAGAFHILDTMVKGLAAAERWTERQMPPVFVYWGRGMTTSWSYYRGERPPGSGRYAFELLGGQPGQQMTTDTDEHDEAIMVHELGHLVMDLVSTDSSLGGRHPPGVLVDPGLAWEEGRVSWFATAALDDPLYQDTIGVEPQGKLRVNRDYSRINAGPQGIGSEQTVGEILWDLSDGAEGIADTDNDGVALGPSGVMRAMIDLAEVDGAFPCIATFLRFLVDTGRVSERDMKEMLRRTGQPLDVLPPSGSVPWPIELSIPSTVTGLIDGLSSPAPSGGPANPSTGYDATKVYRFRLQVASSPSIELVIDGSGTSADNTDLDLELRDIDSNPISESRTAASTETLAVGVLQPGWYVLYVRDGGSGNRASYRLSVR